MVSENNTLPTPQEPIEASEAVLSTTTELTTTEPQEPQDELTPSEEDSFAGKSKAELVDLLARLLESEPIESLRRTVEAIKISFYKQQRADGEAARRAFVEAGGDEADYIAPQDESELRLKDLFKEYRKRRDEHRQSIEQAKELNYKVKLQIIEELKAIVDSHETINHNFTKLRELQSRWRETGPVPTQHTKDLWELYNLHTENFYNFININKELRDLDLKKNLEIKSELCAQAEALAEESSVVEAFTKLQKLHEDWRETGPVAIELKDAIWARFKEASSLINKRHQEHFEQLKNEQVENLERKASLCQQVEEMIEKCGTSAKEWASSSERLLEIQKSWKSIGFAPKKDNNQIYERFRAACDKFFEAKREFFASAKSEMEQNMSLKEALCEKAEQIAQSEEWKKTTDELLALQAEWKKIGAVPRRYSDQIWKRFRAACDKFFERKSAHFSTKDSKEDENLKLKEALLVEMQEADITSGGFDAIKAFQRRWSEIGFVPIKHKDELQKRYKEVVDGMFGAVRGQERERSIGRFKERVTSLKASGERRVRGERERLMQRMTQLKAEVQQLENNIGFFSKSKGAEAMIADVKNKIERAKREVADTLEKIKLIDSE
ncbi:MAG: DUF349 domain-containing protein [Rikenellaceae bacterium]